MKGKFKTEYDPGFISYGAEIILRPYGTPFIMLICCYQYFVPNGT